MARVSTNSGCTTRRFACRFLNQGSGNWIVTRCNVPAGKELSSGGKELLTLQNKKWRLLNPNSETIAFACSTKGSRISNPKKFQLGCSVAILIKNSPDRKSV